MSGRGRRDTVLVVDDEPASLRLLTEAFEAEGLTVLVATSGEAALDILGQTSPDLVLMDARMPGIGGFAATARLRGDPATAHLPVIIMTGLSEAEQAVAGLAAGAVDYLRKPVDVAELLARVRLHIDRARAVHAGSASLDATGRLMLAVDSSARVLWCTPLAAQAIARWAPEWDRTSRTLPDEARTAIERLLARGGGEGPPIRAEREGAAIEWQAVGTLRPGELLVRLVPSNPGADCERLRQRHGLTPREAEVLRWISFGKSNADISEVLSISPRTVQKHLERIFEKLGVESRAAAAAIAIRVTEA